MRILAFGVYYSNNLGDPVLCDCTVSLLQHVLPEAEIVICDMKDRNSFAPVEIKTIYQLRKNRIRGLLRQCATRYLSWDKQKKHQENVLASNMSHITQVCGNSWDMVVFAGGQLFWDGYALFVSAIVQECDIRGIPVIFHACGTGPMYSPYIRNKLSAALQASCVKWISTRDDAEYIDTTYLSGSERKTVSISDSGLWCDLVYQVGKNSASNTIGLGIMYAVNLNIRKTVNFWIRLIMSLHAKGLSWQIFVNGTTDDVTLANYILEKLPDEVKKGKKVILPGTPKELVDVISKFKSIISFRLHSHVIASALGIPGIALVWDEKLRNFYRKLGYSQRCLTIQNTPEDVLMALEKAELQGTDVELVREQREASRQLLKTAIYNVLDLSD